MEARERILEAAFAAFVRKGYAGASTAGIATEARVSKRELYAWWGTSGPCWSPASATAPLGCSCPPMCRYPMIARAWRRC
jgi:hypothetical protein